MTVKMMFEELQKMDPEAQVRMHDRMGEPALFVVALSNDSKTVWLEAESEIDLGNELETQFEHALEAQVDELDFYMELLERGITVETVREYMGTETADHMEGFCKEHGLIF